MELVYLWVGKYNNIENEGFNFSPKFDCNYDTSIHKLLVKKNNDCISIFPKNINITAIVGENGSGKSSILDLLFNNPFNENCFIIIKIDNELECYGVKLKECHNNKISIGSLKTKNTFQIAITKTPKLDNILAFYTPILDNTFTNNKHNYNNKYNFSPVETLSNDMLNNVIYKDINIKNLFKIFQSGLIENTIKLLKNGKKFKIPFNTPTSLTINIAILRDDEKKEYKGKLRFLKDIKRDGDNFFEYLQERVIFTFFIANYKSLKDELLKSINQVETKMTNNYDIDILNEIFKETIFSSNINTIKIFLETQKKQFQKTDNYTIKLKISDIENDFIKNYEKVQKILSSFLDFDWTPILSSGQNTFLLQFSNFYKLEREDNIFLFIDEGETTLHPKWQKNYIEYLVDFFTSNFKNKNIHIILSSHSPFLLSDLPKENIIFLKDGKNVSKTTKINPFGANIHTLLSHGFFMEDGLMGEFAKGKINDVYNFIVNNDTSQITSKNEALNIINLIGEPVIKRQLLELYNEKYTNYSMLLSLDDEINILEKKLNALKKSKND